MEYVISIDHHGYEVHDESGAVVAHGIGTDPRAAAEVAVVKLRADAEKAGLPAEYTFDPDA
jgi:hypothetical protein